MNGCRWVARRSSICAARPCIRGRWRGRCSRTRASSRGARRRARGAALRGPRLLGLLRRREARRRRRAGRRVRAGRADRPAGGGDRGAGRRAGVLSGEAARQRQTSRARARRSAQRDPRPGIEVVVSQFIEVIECLDRSAQTLVSRFPEQGSAEIKLGAQLIVRDSQAAIFVRDGRALDTFGAGRHTLTTLNVPLLTKALSLPTGGKSPLPPPGSFLYPRTLVNSQIGAMEPIPFLATAVGIGLLRAVA